MTHEAPTDGRIGAPITRDGSDYPPFASLPLLSVDPESDNNDSINNTINNISKFLDWLSRYTTWEDANANRGNAIDLNTYINDLINFYIQGVCDIQEHTYPPVDDKLDPLLRLELQIGELQKVLLRMGNTGIEIALKNAQRISDYMTTAQREKSLYLVTIGSNTNGDSQEEISTQRKQNILKAMTSQSTGMCLLALQEAMSINFFDDKGSDPFSIKRLFGHTFAINIIPEHYGLFKILTEDNNDPNHPIATWLRSNGINITIHDDNGISWEEIPYEEIPGQEKSSPPIAIQLGNIAT